MSTRIPVVLLVALLAVAGLATAGPPAHAAAKATSVRGFNLAGEVSAGRAVSDRFRVTGPKRRPVVVQHREPGQRWQKVTTLRTSGTRRAAVAVTVGVSGGRWAWKVRSGGGRWLVAAPATGPVREFRVRVPGRRGWSGAASDAASVTLAPDLGLPPAPGTRVRPERSQQVLVADRSSGARGSYRRYEWHAQQGRWLRVGGSPAVFGYGGVVRGEERVQGSGTTPAGTYRLLYAFGGADPGTAMPYREVTDCSYWVLARKAPDYNRWRESCERPAGDAEHLQTYVDRGLYRHAVVTDFNYDDPRVRRGRGSGGAIFVHYATRYTAGCVGLTSMAELTSTVQWLDPGKNPLIVIKR